MAKRALGPSSPDAEAISGQHRIAPKERRAQARVAVHFPLWVTLEAGALSGVATDLGVGGMFIRAAEPLAYETKVTVEFRSSIAGATLRLPAVVRWSTNIGFGVQFGALGILETREIIRIFQHASRAETD
jgi:hypothetical protein